ncbi:DMT family transporter [Streptomyces sp. SL13]|uniref:DMT family transporter n=1 Tax=Streptantibioticus silvisoli TaxID=2705255 RepID=A0AA90GWQ4_9ACTN|nr:DMT family transporter [Streptantibioticus silvisoli]MDI5969279.1 DMT family transporter [Streptantibioticus silvisoli]
MSYEMLARHSSVMTAPADCPSPLDIPPPGAAAVAPALVAPAAPADVAGDRGPGGDGTAHRASSPLRRWFGGWRSRFLTLSLIWGFSFLFIKVGTEAFSPLQVTLGRMACGTLVLAAALAVRRDRLPRSPRTLARLLVASFLLNALPFSLFAYAELTIPSTLAGICNATTPLFSMVLSFVALSEDRPTRRRVAGAGIGFAGVMTVLGVWQGFSGEDPRGTALALVAAASYAVGWIWVRRTLAGVPESSLSLSTAQLGLGTVQLAIAVPLFTSAPAGFPVRCVLAVVALGTLGTGLAYLLQYDLVKQAGPTIATMVTYVVPVIATAAGVLVLHEGLSWNEPVGALVVLAGAAIAQTRTRSAGKPGKPGGGTS